VVIEKFSLLFEGREKEAALSGWKIRRRNWVSMADVNERGFRNYGSYKDDSEYGDEARAVPGVPAGQQVVYARPGS
jgi:hypothetical protein